MTLEEKTLADMDKLIESCHALLERCDPGSEEELRIAKMCGDLGQARWLLNDALGWIADL